MLTDRRRWGSLLGAWVAVVAGVAVVALSTLLLASARAPVPERIAAAAVLVQSPKVVTAADPFPESRPWSSAEAIGLAGRLAAVPGVAAAVPDRTGYAQPVVGGRPLTGTEEAHGWSSAALAGAQITAGEPPRRDGQVVLDRALGLPVGSAVTLLTAAGPARYLLSGVVAGPGVYLADTEAARLAPGVRAIGLVLRPGADPAQVAAAARTLVGARGKVLTGDDRSALEPRADARTRWIGLQILTGVSTLAGFSAIFVVASTFAFNVTGRRRDLALLRLIGATPQQVRQLLYREALTVGAAAAVVGVALGAALAPAIGDVLIDAGIEPQTYRVHFVAWPLAAAFAIGPVVALLGVWAAARRGSRVHPLEALREAVVESRPMSRTRWIVGILCAAAGLALASRTAVADPIDAGNYALGSAMLLVVAAAVLAPAVIPPLAVLLCWPFALGRGATGMLVRESARSGARRTAGCAAPVLLTVSFTVMVMGLVQTSANAYSARRSATLAVGSVVTPDRTSGLTDAVVAATPGAALLPTTVYVRGDQPIEALGVDPTAYATATNPSQSLRRPLALLRHREAVVLTDALARQFGSHPGQSIAITFADGESAALRVVAVVPDGSTPAGLVLSRAVVRAHDPSALTSAILTQRPAAPQPGSGARVVDVDSYAAEANREDDRLIWIFTLLLIAVSAGYGAIAVANTLLMAAAGRMPDFRVLRLAGATRWQVARTAAAEAVFVVMVGALLGGVVSAVALLSIRHGFSEQVKAPVDLVLPWPPLAGVVACCLALAVTASAGPALRASPRAR